MDLKGYGPTLRVSHIRSGGLGAASSHLSQRSPLQITHPTTLAQMSCSTSRFLIIHFCITSFQNSSHQCGWQKNLTRAQWCASLCCVNSGQVELGFPESPSLFGSRRKGQKNVHGMRQTKVKQQLSLSEISRDQRGTEVPCGSPPPLSSPWLHIHRFLCRLSTGSGLQTHRRCGCTEVTATSFAPQPRHMRGRHGVWRLEKNVN